MLYPAAYEEGGVIYSADLALDLNPETAANTSDANIGDYWQADFEEGEATVKLVRIFN